MSSPKKTGAESLTVVTGTLLETPFTPEISELCAALDAMQKAGIAGGSLWISQCDHLAAQGLSRSDLQALHEERGLHVSMLGALTAWSIRPRDRDAIVAEVDAALAWAAALGTRRLMAVSPTPLTEEWEAVIEGFALACQRAEESQAEVSFEFLQRGGIRDLSTSADLITRSGCENAGLVLDAFQWMRSGCDEKTLRSIAPERIHMLQLCDASADASLDQDLGGMTRRHLPGKGDIDWVQLIRILDEMGAVPLIEIEVFDPLLLSRGVDAMARELMGSSLKVLAQARTER